MQQRRMSKEARRDHLLDTAAEIVATRGAEALTLTTLAEAAGVTKPITYNHFESREFLLLALYRRYDEWLAARMREGLRGKAQDLAGAARVIAASYLDCTVTYGGVYDAAVAALAAYPQHQGIHGKIRRAYCAAFSRALGPFLSGAEGLLTPGRWIALYGVAEELGRAVLDGDLPRAEAEAEIASAMIALTLHPG